MDAPPPAKKLNKSELKRKLDEKMGLTCERHIFLCTGSNCESEGASRTWRELGQRIKAANAEGHALHRTEAKCLKLCRSGPIALVLPEGTYYHSVTPDALGTIVTEHLIGGVPVEEYAFAHVPPTPAAGDTDPNTEKTEAGKATPPP